MQGRMFAWEIVEIMTSSTQIRDTLAQPYRADANSLTAFQQPFDCPSIAVQRPFQITEFNAREIQKPRFG